MANHSVGTEAHCWVSTEVIPVTEREPGFHFEKTARDLWQSQRGSCLPKPTRPIASGLGGRNGTPDHMGTGAQGHRDIGAQSPNPSQGYSTPDTTSRASAVCQVQAQLFRLGFSHALLLGSKCLVFEIRSISLVCWLKQVRPGQSSSGF